MRKERHIEGLFIIVELNETRMWKRKYNRGHHVESVYVLVRIVRTDAKRCFAVDVIKRGADTLKAISIQYIHP